MDGNMRSFCCWFVSYDKGEGYAAVNEFVYLICMHDNSKKDVKGFA